MKNVALRSYCLNLLRYERIPTIEVRVGDTPLGGAHPIRLQSMTVSDTMNTEATVAEAIRMIEAGCEYVRITAPSKKEAENLRPIRDELRNRGYNTPLVADIHFTPNAAEIAADIVEKVRINPGNFVDKKKFEFIEYSDADYAEELQRIRAKFLPLLAKCKANGVALRIGANHGSLSDRIMSRYGDNPQGMVASAMEFVDICEDEDFDQIVISMKSSNPVVMVAAYRLLMQTMLRRGRVYPVHLGVTEAGEGEDGRLKSALGIGALLADGVGDTVRVSLTEPAEHEIPVAEAIVRHFETRYAGVEAPFLKPTSLPIDPFAFNRRATDVTGNIGGEQTPRVIADFSHKVISEQELMAVGHYFSLVQDKWTMNDLGVDYIYTGKSPVPFMLPNGLKAIYDAETWRKAGGGDHSFPYYSSLTDWRDEASLSFVRVTLEDITQLEAQDIPNVVLVFEPLTTAVVYEYRNAIFRLINAGRRRPVILHLTYSQDDFQLAAACDASVALADGLIDGLWLTSPDPESANRTAFGLLQASRQRITRTEYISCPSCGRTLFDLQETTARIRRRTEHLKGVKIAVMGCIVNGPGEMADADYGYVGAGPDVISLYRGKEMVEKGVRTAQAVDRLIDLIREDGRWREVEN